MPPEAPLTDDQREAQMHDRFLDGKASAWEDVSSWLFREAAGLFSYRKDTQAVLVRDLSDEARKVAAGIREGQRVCRAGSGL